MINMLSDVQLLEDVRSKLSSHICTHLIQTMASVGIVRFIIQRERRVCWRMRDVLAVSRDRDVLRTLSCGV